VGDPVTLVTERAGSFAAVIVAVDGGAPGLRATVRVLGAARAERSPLLSWSIAVAPVKGEPFEAAVRTVAELGLGRLVPVLTERTVVRAEPGSGRVERWRRIAREATKQCGREPPLEILEPIGLPRFLETWQGVETRREGETRAENAPKRPAGFVLIPGAPFPEGISGLQREEGGPLPPAVFLIGPEGGFTPQEAERAQESGFAPAGFPVPTLRTPTAVALVAALGLLVAGGLRVGPPTP
jgi:16S rRNA (uracil1498-N3)-methyltransferase